MASNPQPRFKQSAETVAVLALMRDARIGEIVTYEAMQTAIRTPCSRHRLVSVANNARRIIERDFHMSFENVPNTGYQRLSDKEKVESVSKHFRTIRRTAAKAVKRLATVDVPSLDAGTATKHSVQMAVLSVVSGEFSSKRMLRLEGDRGTAPDVRKQLGRLKG